MSEGKKSAHGPAVAAAAPVAEEADDDEEDELAAPVTSPDKLDAPVDDVVTAA